MGYPTIEPERGMVLPLIALMLSVLIGVAALVVDVGNARRVQEDLITATDAAALAAAYDYASSSPSPCTTASAYVDDNLANTDDFDCSPVPNGSFSGHVSVSADFDTDAWFAPILGLSDELEVSTRSIAAWGPPAGAGHLIPLTFCIDASPTLSAVLNTPAPSGVQPFRVDFDQANPADCGNTISVNWGEIHFDDVASHPSSSVFEDWVEEGYDGITPFGSNGATSCSSNPYCLRGSTNNHVHWATVASELNNHITSGKVLYVPIHDYGLSIGSGGGADFHVVGVVRARLTNYNITGPPNTWFFEMDAETGPVSGPCCGDASTSGGAIAIAICAVKPSDLGACP